MTHLDSEMLVLVAMAEAELNQSQRMHLEACPSCGRELRALRRTVATGRSARTVELVAPDAQLWSRIHAALGLSQAVAAPPGKHEFESARRVGPATEAPGEEAPGEASGFDGPVGAESPDVPKALSAASASRWRGWVPLTAAAGVFGLMGGIAAGIWWQSSRTPDAVPVVATARLEALPGWEASGDALVEEWADGSRDVIVDLTASGDMDFLREVWLTTVDGSGLVSIGLLDGPSGRFAIPDGIDLAEYPVIDVSAEFDDGDPAHSGDSIVRGELHSG